MDVVRTTTWLDNQVLTAPALNGEFNNLLSAPNIVNADIAAGAAIAGSKLANPLTGITMTTPTLNKPVINGTDPTAATYTPGSGSQTVALDVSANNMHIVTGNAAGTAITFTITGATNNQPFIVIIKQGAVVSTIASWFAGISWAGGTPTLTATINKTDTFGFIRTGANTYLGYIVGQNA